jgi:hypothetical protein
VEIIGHNLVQQLNGHKQKLFRMKIHRLVSKVLD